MGVFFCAYIGDTNILYFCECIRSVGAFLIITFWKVKRRSSNLIKNSISGNRAIFKIYFIFNYLIGRPSALRPNKLCFSAKHINDVGRNACLTQIKYMLRLREWIALIRFEFQSRLFAWWGCVVLNIKLHSKDSRISMGLPSLPQNHLFFLITCSHFICTQKCMRS